MYKINAETTIFYHERLYGPSAKIAQDYVKQRKLDNNTFINHFTYLFLIQKDIDINSIKIQESEVSNTALVNKKKYNELFNNKEMVEAIKYCNKILDYMK